MSQVRLQTSFGAIFIELYDDKTPKTVANFLNYVRESYYDNTLFHRVIDNFMIQGGGFLPGMVQKSAHAPIENEGANSMRNERGTLSMARTSDPHSATAQFFVNVADNDFLNYTAPNPAGWGYCVFGKVADGMTVIDRIKGVPTGTRAGQKDVPLTDIIIEQATIVE